MNLGHIQINPEKVHMDLGGNEMSGFSIDLNPGKIDINILILDMNL